IRKTIAGRMKMSLENSAQLTETAYADVTALAELRENDGVKLSWNVLIMFAVVKALKEHLYMNGRFENGLWHESETVELGVATDTEEGLFVPVIKKACSLSLEELDAQTRKLVEEVQNRTITQENL